MRWQSLFTVYLEIKMLYIRKTDMKHKIIINKGLNLLFIISIIFFLFLVVFTKRTYSISFETPATSFGSPDQTGKGIAIGDFDSDGNRDIVALANSSLQNIRIWKNPGSTTAFSVLWASRSVGAMAITLSAVALADLDNDGSIDIVTGNSNAANSTVYAWKNPGPSVAFLTTTVWASSLILSTNTGVNALFMADLDSTTNKFPDIIIGGASKNLQIVRNPETNVFSTSPWPSATIIYSKTGADIVGVWAGRIDSDNTPDIVTGAGAATAGPVQEVHIFKNPGFASAFDSPSVWDSNPVANLSVNVFPVALADLDKDGSKDIAVGMAASTLMNSAVVRIYRNPGSTIAFTATWVSSNAVGYSLSSESIGGGQQSLKIAALDGDGDIDIAITMDYNSKRITVYNNPLNPPTNNDPFTTAWVTDFSLIFSNTPNYLALQDINSDNKVDIVSNHTFTTPFYVVKGLKNTTAETRIELLYFMAIPSDGKVTLKWKTETEINNYGFNIYRSEDKNGGDEKIHYKSASGNLGGELYSFADTDVVNGKRYYYKLEDVDTNGETEIHGPASAVPDKIALIELEYGGKLSKQSRFKWNSNEYTGFKLQFSSSPDFSSNKTLSIPKSSWSSKYSTKLTEGMLSKVKKLGKKNGSIYWRVIGRDKNGKSFTSAASSLVVE